MASPFGVLFSSAGRRVALMRLFEAELVAMGLEPKIFAADMSRCSAAFQVAHRAVQVPRCTSQSFIQEIRAFCEAHGVSLIIPTIDTELPVYARHRDELARAGVLVAVSGPETIRVAGSKIDTHAFLMENDLPTVEQATPEAILAAPTRWAFPLIAKPAGGSNSVGLRTVTSLAELAPLTGGDYIVQTFARGSEYTVSTFVARDGQCLAAVPRRRLEVRGGEVSKGATVRVATVEQLARRVCEALPDAYGALNVQIFYDRATGDACVIELNARFGGGCPLALTAGMQSHRWLVEDALARPNTPPAAWREALVMLRYDDAVFVSASEAGLDDAGDPLGSKS